MGVDEDTFKFFKLEGYPDRYPISENLFKQKDGQRNVNYAYFPFAPGKGYGLISFSIQYGQTASIKIYEYKAPPKIVPIDFQIGGDGARRPINEGPCRRGLQQLPGIYGRP